MSDIEQRIQIFKDYSIEFSTKIPKVDEKFARLIIQYLYKNDNIMIEDNNNNDYIVLLENNVEIPNITKETENTIYSYGLLINSFTDSNGKYIIAGLIVSSKEPEKNIPYLFICSGNDLKFWKTNINNYDGNFIFNRNEFMIENRLGIKSFNEDSSNNNHLTTNSLSKLFLPFKSNFLLGPSIDIIKDQQQYIYQSSGAPISFIFKDKSLMIKPKVNNNIQNNLPVQNPINNNVRRKTNSLRRKK